MTYTSRPDFYFGIAFNADPNDPVSVPTWTDLTSSVRSVGGVQRGKQYELDQVLAADPTVTIRDPGEMLNPENTGSVLYPNVQPYRETLWVGQWPNYGGGTAPVGNANLMNANTWGNPIDPSLESYTVGTFPGAWFTPNGNAYFISTTTPHAGTKCLRTPGTTDPNLNAPATWITTSMPGRQYTSSVWFRQSLTDTWAAAVSGINTASDLFNRSLTSSWGTADAGGAWSNLSGSASDFSVVASQNGTPGLGLHAQTSTGVGRRSRLPVSVVDANVSAWVSPTFTASNQVMRLGVSARLDAGGGNAYTVAVEVSPDGSTANLLILKSVAFTETILVTQALPFNYDPRYRVGVRINVVEQVIQATVWREDQTVPNQPTRSVTDSSLTAAGGVGVYSQLETGTTGTNVLASFADFCATSSIIGTSSATSGSYVRLSVTFTATQPSHQVYLRGIGTLTASNATCLDDFQHESGAAATTNSTTGPVIYPIMRNFAERFTRIYDDSGYEGSAEIPCVDAVAALSATTIPVEYQAALLNTAPLYCWPLSDTAGGASFAEILSGGPSLVPMNTAASGTPGTLQPGSSIDIPGIPNAVGLGITTDPTSFAGVSLYTNGISGLDQPGAVNLTMALWLQNPGPVNNGGIFSLVGRGGDTNPTIVSISRDATPLLDFAGGAIYTGGGSGTSTVANGNKYNDGQGHMFVYTLATVGSNVVSTFYTDGGMVSQTTKSVTAAFGGPGFNLLLSQVGVSWGGFLDGFGDGPDAIYGGATLWNRALGSIEVATLWVAGQGFNGETSGSRVARHLVLGKYTGPTRISPGTTTMGPESYNPTIDLASDTSNTTTAENGDWWVAPDGAVVFEGRQQRYTRFTSTWTLTDAPSAGQAPYLSGIQFDDDPTFIYANVQVARPNGINAVGGSPADVNAATRRYFGRSLAAQVDVADDGQAQSLADWTFYTHNRPATRLAQLTIDPASNPALWPVVLGMELGQRVTVIKHDKAANNGAGFTYQGDHFIEQITHDDIDMDSGTWTTTVVLSPIGSATTGNGLTVQPWIVGDSVLGIIGVTSIPAY